MAATKQTGAAQSSFTSSDKARFLLRPAQKTDQLCRNPKPCSYGDRCIFAHNMEEQRCFRQAYGFGGSGGQGGNQGAGTKEDGQPAAQPYFLSKYKTQLCIYFERQGYCTRGDQCKFAHGEGELRSEGQRSSKESNTAEFSPAPPPPPAAVRAPSSLAGDTAASSGSGGSAFCGEAEAESGIAPAELDEAYALQLQYDEQRCLKEEAQQAQRAQQDSPERAAGGSYAAAAGAGTEAAAAEVAPPGLALPPRLDSEAAFPSLQAAGVRSKAGSEAARSQRHSRAPSSGGCSMVDGASPMTACPSEEGTQRAASSCDASVTTEADLLAHAGDGSEATPSEGAADGGSDTAAGGQEDGEEEELQQQEGGVDGEEAATAAGPQRAASRGSWADEADAEEAEEAAQYAAAAAPALLPPPPHQRAMPPAEVLLQALRSSSAAAAAATAAAVPTDSGSPLRQAVRLPPSFRPRSSSVAHSSPAQQPRLLPADFVGASGGVDLSVIPHFVCPLTSRPFVDPVVAADGVTYERDVIEFLLYRKHIEMSPVLRGVRLEHNMLVPNTALLCAMGEVAALLASWAAAVK